MTEPGYPNVHVRLRLFQQAPAVPDRDSEIEIWLKGTRFHVRDHACRPLSYILEDVTATRGLGRPVKSIEEMMDLGTLDGLRDGSSPTEMYGDLASDEGWVREPVDKRGPVPASVLAPVAEQILSRGKADGLRLVNSMSRLGRAATEYRGQIGVTEDGEQYENSVRRVIAPPLLLFEQVHDAATPRLAYTREVLAIEEGVVTDADVTPPASIKRSP